MIKKSFFRAPQRSHVLLHFGLLRIVGRLPEAGPGYLGGLVLLLQVPLVDESFFPNDWRFYGNF